MREAITHIGKITKVSPTSVTVSIAPTDDECCKCAISSLCSKSDDIEVPYANASADMVGTEVQLVAPIGLRHKAIVLFLLIPIILLIAILAILMASGASEGISAVSSILAVVLWYIVLFAARVNIRQKATFTIKSV